VVQLAICLWTLLVLRTYEPELYFYEIYYILELPAWNFITFAGKISLEP